MAIISQETWDNMPEEEKEELQQYHKWLYNLPGSNGTSSAISAIEGIFGKENLQSKPKIRTWEDVEKQGYYVQQRCLYDLDQDGKGKDNDMLLAIAYDNDFSDKIILKAVATLKIAKLIELGYGGMVTDEEWKDLNIPKYWIDYHPTCQDEKDKFQISLDEDGDAELSTQKHFITFHTQQQAEEFMSYPENVELVKQYYMI